MPQSPTQKSLLNVCLFCNEHLNSTAQCRYCGFKFCKEHITTEKHQCIKTRYIGFTRVNSKTQKQPNVVSGKFKVICEKCGYVSPKSSSIEYAGEELTQHSQLVGCGNNIYLEELLSDESGNLPEVEKEVNISESHQTSIVDFKNYNENNLQDPAQSGTSTKSENPSSKTINSSKSEGQKFLLGQISPLVEHLTKLAELKERKIISENEFTYIKTELIKKLGK